ncbi:MAG: hypothetical protein Q4D02_02685 [Clostridia bacterium]|nr:hypothetical protein [Clostridia bacterium]
MKSEKLEQMEGFKIGESPADGFILWAKGDFNDGDILEKSWTFGLDEADLVTWLLKAYTSICGYHYWYEKVKGYDKILLREYIPEAHDTCIDFAVHTVYQFKMYLILDGVCREIQYDDTFEVEDSEALCEKYVEDYDCYDMSDE